MKNILYTTYLIKANVKYGGKHFVILARQT